MAWTAGGGLLAVAAAGLILRLWFPPEKIRKLVLEKASAALRREVRLRGVSLGVLKGLTLDGLEVSESPDFKAGKFLGVDEFVLKIELMPLLGRKIVVDEISVTGPSLAVVKNKKGLFNFDDLIAEEAPKAKAAKKEEPASFDFELKVRKVSLTGGRVEYRDLGGGLAVDLKDIEVAAKDFDFDQKSGKLGATLTKAAADLSNLPMSISGKVTLDPKKAELKDWKGKLGDGDLKLTLVAKDYLKSPAVELAVNLSSLDLDRLMAVKEKTMSREPQPSAGTAAGKSQSTNSGPGASAPIRTKGQATIEKLTYQGARLNTTKLSWELSGVTPDLRSVAGTAKLHVDGGAYEGAKAEGGKNGVVKALMMPLTVLGKLGSALSPLKVFPDFSHLLFSEVVGDYFFSHGVMTIKDFHMYSAAVGVTTTGTVDLGAQRLNLVAAVAPVNTVPIEIAITGPIDNPSKKPKLSTLIKPGANAVKEATQLLKNLNIFKK